MRFCVLNSERQDTCYHELYKGKWDSEKMEFWRDDSLYIHDDIFVQYPKLIRAIKKAVPSYDAYNETAITAHDWDEIGKLLAECDQDTKAFYAEINEWAGQVLEEYGVFTMLGL